MTIFNSTVSLRSEDNLRIFYPVSGNYPQLMNVLREIFERILTPLYGPQEDALNKIAFGKDRVCYLLYEDQFPVGVISFKNILSNEFSNFGIKNSIEIKSLFVVDSTHNSGRGLGSALLDKITQEVALLNLNHDFLHVTVSETKRESLIFFLKKGFSIKHTWIGKYQKNTVEHLLSLPARINVIAEEYFPSFTPRSEDEKKLETHQLAPQMVGCIPNAHWDDIHTLKKLSDGTFVSGSKDNTLCKWDEHGILVRTVREVEPMGVDSKAWITALAVLNDEYWVSGERTGRVCLWNTAGDYIRDLKLKLPRNDHHSHVFNQSRINCLSPGLNPQKLSFFAGFPTLFNEYNLIESQVVHSQRVHKNDWVYCIHPLQEDRMLLVIAGNLQIWKKVNNSWNKVTSLIKEPEKHKSKEDFKTRSHISVLTKLLSSPHHFGAGIFDGSVKVVDIQQEQVIAQWQEHKEKVWAIENIYEKVFASSSADGLIKLWDIRSEGSVHTLDCHVGEEVCSLLQLKENLLVAGSCTKETDLLRNKHAQIVFYDIRK